MIVDCFPFFNELDLLEIRLHELSDIVDVFVLSEATLTFTGKPKLLYFTENKDRYAGFADRIEHVVIDSYNGVDKSNAWDMDYYQKQCGVDAMMEKLNPSSDDIVIISDVDEISSSEALKQAKDKEWTIATAQMSLYYYYMNCQCVNRSWRFPKWIRPEGRLSASKIRRRKTDITFKNAGWHFSYLSNTKDIKLKIDSFAHTEYAKPPFNTFEHIETKKTAGKDLFGRKLQFEFIDNLNYLPNYVLGNMDKFKKHIYQKGE